MNSRLPGAIACLIISASLVYSLHLYADEWKLRKNRKGIQVYTRSVPGSKFKEFKATTELEASMTSILALMEDIPSYQKWFPRLRESKLLKMISSREMILYQVMDIPFPARDRDSVFRVLVTRDARTGSVTFNLSSAWDYVPERSGVVRVKIISGSWTFVTDRNKGTVTVVYQMHSEPGGSLTPLLTNAAVVKRPFTVLMNMREMLKEPRYRDARKSDVRLLK